MSDDDETVFDAVKRHAEEKLIEVMSFVTYRAFAAGWLAARTTDPDPDYDGANCADAWDRWLDTEKAEETFREL